MIKMEPKQQGDKYTLAELYHIIELLRSPEGCPWDREQTHESLIKPMIEEAYEAVDAIKKESPEKLCEELGDVLLQVIFHSILSKEENTFDFDDVTDRCARKMLFRHTHVFGDAVAGSAGEALANWDSRKLVEKGFSSLRQDLEDVPDVLPALMRAQKVAKKIRKADQKEGKQQAAGQSNSQSPSAKDKSSFDEIGKKLYELCREADLSDVDAELALTAYLEGVIQNENR